MIYKWVYKTPSEFDDILMNSDGEYLTGLCFIGSKDENKQIVNCKEKELPIFKETRKWLDIYFSGKNPDFTPKYKINNLTPFRQECVDIMNTIPFGKTITYNDISKITEEIKECRKIKKYCEDIEKRSYSIVENIKEIDKVNIRDNKKDIVR